MISVSTLGILGVGLHFLDFEVVFDACPLYLAFFGAGGPLSLESFRFRFGFFVVEATE